MKIELIILAVVATTLAEDSWLKPTLKPKIYLATQRPGYTTITLESRKRLSIFPRSHHKYIIEEPWPEVNNEAETSQPFLNKKNFLAKKLRHSKTTSAFTTISNEPIVSSTEKIYLLNKNSKLDLATKLKSPIHAEEPLNEPKTNVTEKKNDTNTIDLNVSDKKNDATADFNINAVDKDVKYVKHEELTETDKEQIEKPENISKEVEVKVSDAEIVDEQPLEQLRRKRNYLPTYEEDPVLKILNLSKRNVIVEENIGSTTAGNKFTGMESRLRSDLSYKNIHH